MRWMEITVEARRGATQELCERLEELGVGGMAVEDGEDFEEFLRENRSRWDYVDDELSERFEGSARIRFYLTDDEAGKSELKRIRSAMGVEMGVGYIEDADWENSWREYYEPIEAGQRLVVVPEWLDAPDNGRIALRLDPGLIFGTGSHATTQMCLEALERYAHPGARALDLGCGSGILGIGALLLGCGSVTGCDIDPKAPDVAYANVRLNGIGRDNFRILAGDVLSDPGLRRELGGGYDLVLANIVADVIIPLSPFALEYLGQGGVFICSGIIEGRQAETERALTASGFDILEHREREDWYCFAAAVKN